jgi:hypothetical protein
MGPRDYWERGRVLQRDGKGDRSNRLRAHRGATKSGESARKLCEGAETLMCGFETKVRQTGAAVERSGVGQCGIVQLLTSVVQMCRRYRHTERLN